MRYEKKTIRKKPFAFVQEKRGFMGDWEIGIGFEGINVGSS